MMATWRGSGVGGWGRDVMQKDRNRGRGSDVMKEKYERRELAKWRRRNVEEDVQMERCSNRWGVDEEMDVEILRNRADGDGEVRPEGEKEMSRQSVVWSAPVSTLDWMEDRKLQHQRNPQSAVKRLHISVQDSLTHTSCLKLHKRAAGFRGGDSEP